MVNILQSFKNLFKPGNDYASTLHQDSFISSSLNYGTANDKLESFVPRYKARINDNVLRELYRSNRLIRRIVNKLPDDMTREKYQINHDESEFYQAEFTRLKIRSKINEAEKYARLFGAGFIIIDFNDNEPLDVEVNLRRVTEIKSLRVLDKTYMQPHLFVPFEGVTHYRLNGLAGIGGLIHASRVIMLDGEETDIQSRIDNQGTGESIVDQLVDQVRNVYISHGAAAQIVTDFSQAVYKIKNFDAMLRADKSQALRKKFTAMNLTRSIMNAVVIDADKEEFTRQSTNVSGLKDMIEVQKDFITALSGMPKTLLFGTSPSGGLTSGDGQSEKRDWFDSVKEAQERKHRSPVQQLLDLITIIKKISESPTFDFSSLWQPTLEQQQAAKKTQAETDKIYKEIMALSSDEVRMNRFKDDGFNFETRIEGDSPGDNNQDLITQIGNENENNN